MAQNSRAATNSDSEPSSDGRRAQLCTLSIVMPTFNRAQLLEEVIRRTHTAAKGFEVEWIVIDDGSTDQTPEVLARLQREIPELTFRSVSNGGPGQARNLGASLARHEVVLFMGDDILPCDDDFLRVHAEMHAEFPTKKLAVLGKAVWPDNHRLDVGHVMRHIQGHGGEQFGYADFPAYELLDYRFFYTCNISVKRDIVSDWLQEGFSSAFPAASWEDVEFAYRVFKKLGGMEILYAPSSCGYHLHRYDVASFIRRQETAGAMAHVFSAMHPEMGPMVRAADIYEAMRAPLAGDSAAATADYIAALEGLKAWARIIEREHRLGNEAWHDDLLFAVFEAAYLQGYVSSAATACTNFAKAYSRILHNVKWRLGRIIDSELRCDAAFRTRLFPVT
jgi:Glycosyltransferases involved in cell wall biogenesis